MPRFPSLHSARKNKTLQKDPFDLEVTEADFDHGVEQYAIWHWGIAPTRVVEWADPEYPDTLIECGRLIRLHVATPRGGRHPRHERDTMLELSRSASRRAHIAYDPKHTRQRLYVLLPPEVRKVVRDRFWDQNPLPSMPLKELARVAGGPHGRRGDYPDVRVKAIGLLTGVMYYTHKKGDENGADHRSFYLHKMGEETHEYPILAADGLGRLWIAGGAYESRPEGITN